VSIDRERLKSIIESLIFVSDAPLPFAKIRAVLEGVPTKNLGEILNEMIEEHQAREGGFFLEEVAMGYQFRTRTENAQWVKMLLQTKPQRLSKAALEILAIIAYNQPITRPQIESIRGVDSSSAVNALLERNLVRILGRKDAPGKPFLFGTTHEFLETFNLKDLSQLPTLKDISDLEEADFEGSADTSETEQNDEPGPDDPEDPGDTDESPPDEDANEDATKDENNDD